MWKELLAMLVFIAAAIANPPWADTERSPRERYVMNHEIKVFLDSGGHRFAFIAASVRPVNFNLPSIKDGINRAVLF